MLLALLSVLSTFIQEEEKSFSYVEVCFAIDTAIDTFAIVSDVLCGAILIQRRHELLVMLANYG